MMQSSPPTRAHLRPTSPTASDYTLDLGALDSASDTETSIPKPRADRIFSEDIDGPSDFTQNMEMWMRGGSLKKRAKKVSAVLHKDAGVDARVDEGTGREELQSKDTLHVPKHDAGEEEENTRRSNHTPDHSPPKVSVLEDNADESFEQDDRDEPFSSEWQTYGNGSTPIPPVHKQFLQPMVEDYNSELSPARQHGSSLRGRQLKSADQSQRQSHAREGGATPGRASSPTLSPVRSPAVQRQASGQGHRQDIDYEAQYERQVELESQLRELQLKCEQLEHLNSALGQAVEEERRLRKQEKASHDTQMAEAVRRERDLTEMKEAAHRHSEEFRREFGELKEQLQDQQRAASTIRKGCESNDAAELRRLREQMKQQNLEHGQAMRNMEQDLDAARRGRDDAEETARLLRKESDEQREEHDAEAQRLRSELQHAREEEAVVTGLESRLENADMEVRRLNEESVERKGELKAVREQAAESKKIHHEELSRASADRTRAVELAAALQRTVQELRLQLKEDQARQGAEVKRLRSAHGEGNKTSEQELNIVRAELDAKQSELNEAILERDEAQDDLEAMQAGAEASRTEKSILEAVRAELEVSQAEKAGLKTRLTDLETLNIELDRKVSETLRNREQYWKQRLEKSDEERKLMAKALLHQWGREEVGIEIPQRFAYKYSTSPTKVAKS
ncbi:unnamed protein product [Zymoseptoria tritici ST99CH_3D1]|uniref:Uncharacterized protein n=1 Tax=Zymoseptoria tritici ST99CH_1E4 TaxID=1276532 RepID=A0A2H1GUB6_ZYMTR|nr:unnamed protein product [Zymoseptoria tritici ST99CH_1E4]SMR60037.1 unnamed protein product [Zymoseptoria tritici ST99CH_3D1]